MLQYPSVWKKKHKQKLLLEMITDLLSYNFRFIPYYILWYKKVCLDNRSSVHWLRCVKGIHVNMEYLTSTCEYNWWYYAFAWPLTVPCRELNRLSIHLAFICKGLNSWGHSQYSWIAYWMCLLSFHSLSSPSKPAVEIAVGLPGGTSSLPMGLPLPPQSFSETNVLFVLSI